MEGVEMNKAFEPVPDKNYGLRLAPTETDEEPWELSSKCKHGCTVRVEVFGAIGYVVVEEEKEE